MAPLCSNCGGTEFVWAGELKTGGRLGQGPLALRSGGELPLGTRICRECGHADLFLRDVAVLKNPHHWKPGEFVPISSPAPAHHGHHVAEPAHAKPVPAPPLAAAPAMTPEPLAASPPPPPPPPAAPPAPSMPDPAPPVPSSSPSGDGRAAAAVEPEPVEAGAPTSPENSGAKKGSKKRSTRTKRAAAASD